jgi:ribosomal protein S18 acetylase RimI-like enzyme
MTVLDNPCWAALSGAQARFADRHGRAARYQRDVSPFYAFADPADPRAWADMAALVAPGEEFWVPVGPDTVPPGWELVVKGDAVQMSGHEVYAEADPEAITLTAADVPEMIDLVKRTEPGPFLPRTIELGTYVGIRRDGALVAMAGERMHPPGWTEISAVCTDPAYRGQRLATRLVETVIAGIRGRGEVPFLHTQGSNTAAINLYRRMGFKPRNVVFGAYRRAVNAEVDGA